MLEVILDVNVAAGSYLSLLCHHSGSRETGTPLTPLRVHKGSNNKIDNFETSAPVTVSPCIYKILDPKF
jgi:hypothetical protein